MIEISVGEGGAVGGVCDGGLVDGGWICSMLCWMWLWCCGHHVWSGRWWRSAAMRHVGQGLVSIYIVVWRVSHVMHFGRSLADCAVDEWACVMCEQC